jgi:hypothetical protein
LQNFPECRYDTQVFNEAAWLRQVLNILKKKALYFARKEYCRSAILERADLSAIKGKPPSKIFIGLGLIAFSYVIGLPAVVAMGVVAVWVRKPLVAIVGGPVIYAISTLVFIIGIRMAGEKYFQVFSRGLTRVILEKILGNDLRAITGEDPDNGPRG